MTTDRARATLGAAVGAVVGLVALGPALAPGYLLFYDMVFVPHLPLNRRTLGIDGSVPRAVPNDLVVALLSHLAPGWVVQKVLLLAVFILAGAGVALLVRSRVAAVAGALAATWNPYLAERLAIGHWAFLLGYALLPWLAVAAARARLGGRRGRTVLFAAVIALALTGSTGAVMGVVLMLAVLLVPIRGHASASVGTVSAALGVTVLANATWWYPYLFLAPHGSGDPAGARAFAAAGDTPYGTFLSLVTGGGIWNKGVWFSDRSSALLAGVALLATLACLGVWLRGLLSGRDAAERGVALAGVLGLFIAALPAVPGGLGLVAAIITHVPGGGLLRDSQKFVALWWLVVAVAVGHTAQTVWRLGARVGSGRALRVIAVAAVAGWSVVTLPGLAWGAQGAWRAVSYPSGMLALAHRIDSGPPGAVAVFPWTLYRRYAWDGNRVVLDPWQRLLGRPVLVDDDLPLAAVTVRGESPQARAVTDTIASGGDVAGILRGSGVRWVVVETDQPGADRIPALRGSTQVASGPGVRLLDLGPVSSAEPAVPSIAGRPGWPGYVGLTAAIAWTIVAAARRLRA